MGISYSKYKYQLPIPAPAVINKVSDFSSNLWLEGNIETYFNETKKKLQNY
jgi:hypothetical protein